MTLNIEIPKKYVTAIVGVVFLFLPKSAVTSILVFLIGCYYFFGMILNIAGFLMAKTVSNENN